MKLKGRDVDLQGVDPVRTPQRAGLLLPCMAAAAFAICAYVALAYQDQPLLDFYSFRQTQTALTAYWLAKDGFRLAYETPVGGAPWSIPFEFPFYQWLVAILAGAKTPSLDATGRIVSFLFLAACALPAWMVTRRLELSRRTFWVFLALLFTAPAYLYYGRTFLVETAALFFALMAIPFYLDVIDQRRSARASLLFLLFASLAVLQKSTTVLPVLVVLGAALALRDAFVPAGRGLRRRGIDFALGAFLLLVPIVIGYAWVSYTDAVKSGNALGRLLTSAALSNWNWGSVEQRMTLPLYKDVMWDRVFSRNVAGWLGIALLAASIAFGRARVRWIVGACLAAGLLPLMLFSNLHIHHDYYQVSCIAFLLFGVSVAVVEWLEPLAGKGTGPVVLGVMLVSNFVGFSQAYLDFTRARYDKSNSRDLAITEILRRDLPEAASFVAFGNDWSSSFAYYSGRKGFTVPKWFPEYGRVLDEAEKYMGSSPLGAMVSCPNEMGPPPEKVLAWAARRPDWRMGLVHGCHVAVKEEPTSAAAIPASTTICEGNLEPFLDAKGQESLLIRDGTIRVVGWTTIDGRNGVVPAAVFVTLTSAGRMQVFQALQVPRADVDRHFGRQRMDDAGFSRLIDASNLSGTVTVGIARRTKAGLERCQFLKNVEIAAGGRP